MHPVVDGISVIYGVGFSSNVYIISDRKRTFLIDCGLTKPRLKTAPAFVVLTHGHIDHTRGVSGSWRTFIHEEELNYVHDSRIPNSLRKIFYIPKNAEKLATPTFEFGDFEFEVVHTPGHTIGSVCLFEKTNRILFSGDTLFSDGECGRTDLGGDEGMMSNSLRKLSSLNYGLLCPGHGEISEL
ncbi:MAG: MBL fold metallo-hydrolase [Candidatus Micrarchaeia archaeon]